jgi:hypothetical protein
MTFLLRKMTLTLVTMKMTFLLRKLTLTLVTMKVMLVVLLPLRLLIV